MKLWTAAILRYWLFAKIVWKTLNLKMCLNVLNPKSKRLEKSAWISLKFCGLCEILSLNAGQNSHFSSIQSSRVCPKQTLFVILKARADKKKWFAWFFTMHETFCYVILFECSPLLNNSTFIGIFLLTWPKLTCGILNAFSVCFLSMVLVKRKFNFQKDLHTIWV